MSSGDDNSDSDDAAGSGPDGADAAERAPGAATNPWAELDAADMEELQAGRVSQDHDPDVFLRNHFAGPIPGALRVAAAVSYLFAAIAVISAVAGGVYLSSIRDGLRGALEDGIASQPKEAAKPDQVPGLVSWVPPTTLVLIVLTAALLVALVRATIKGNSRGARNFLLAAIVVAVLMTPIGINLVFDYDAVPGWLSVAGWVQLALLVVLAVTIVTPGVGRWLPPAERLRPFRRG